MFGVSLMRFAIDDTGTVTVLLVGADGRVRWRTTGPMTEVAGAELLAALDAGDAHEVAAGIKPAAVEQFEFDVRPRFRRMLALIGVMPATAYVTLSAERLVARFGPWTCETPVANVRAVCRTGPYRWFKAIGRAWVVRRSWTDVRYDNGWRCLRAVV